MKCSFLSNCFIIVFIVFLVYWGCGIGVLQRCLHIPSTSCRHAKQRHINAKLLIINVKMLFRWQKFDFLTQFFGLSLCFSRVVGFWVACRQDDVWWVYRHRRCQRWADCLLWGMLVNRDCTPHCRRSVLRVATGVCDHLQMRHASMADDGRGHTHVRV